MRRYSSLVIRTHFQLLLELGISQVRPERLAMLGNRSAVLEGRYIGRSRGKSVALDYCTAGPGRGVRRLLGAQDKMPMLKRVGGPVGVS